MVEDEAQVGRLVARLLEADGFRVLSRESGGEALALLREGDTQIDVLLTDMMLPDVDGGELARQALELRPELRIVYRGSALTEIVRSALGQPG